MAMSESESKFIRQLKITLISILGPFILLTSGSMVNDHFKIKDNQDHIQAMEETLVSREILLLYVNDQRQMVELLRVDMRDHCTETDQDMTAVNKRLDQIIKDVYEVRKRNSIKDKL